MARAPKSENNIQVFNGSRPQPDVFAANAGSGCCGTGVDLLYDKLGERVRFDNGLKHLSPAGGVERYRFPAGNGFNSHKADILRHINAVGVGAEISVIAIPTYAFVTGIGIHIAAYETGLTFDLVTRNGLLFPNSGLIVTAEVDPDSPCGVTRTVEEVAGEEGGEGEPAGPVLIEGFGALGADELFIDHFDRDGQGRFALEADELILRVASMPVSGVVSGLFDLTVSASYDVIYRAEQ